jgi:hypothetical protein
MLCNHGSLLELLVNRVIVSSLKRILENLGHLNLYAQLGL